MKFKSAFTLIEVMIAIALSSIIIFGMMQNYNNVVRYLNYVRETLNETRRTCLLFNQIERDFSTAFIPPLLETMKPEKTAQGADQKQTQNKEAENTAKKPAEKDKATKDKEDAQKKEKLKLYFVAQRNDNEISKKLNDQRCFPFKSVSFINTNPLQVYGEKRICVVRVIYEMVIDKARSKGELLSYKLYRKEVEDLDNVAGKENEFENVKDKKKVVRTHLVADGIKDLFLQYVYMGYKKTDDKKAQEKKEIEELLLDVWGTDKKETFGVVPCRVNILVSFWNDKLTKSVTYQAVFPILSFSLVKDEQEEKSETSPQNTSPTPQPNAGNPTGPTTPQPVQTQGGQL